MYQPDKLFANLNLFQIRQGRREKEHESILFCVLFFKVASIQLLNTSLAEFKEKVNKLTTELDAIMSVRNQ